MDSPAMDPATPLPKDWKRNVAVFLASQAVSLLGSALVQYAIIWHITLTTRSGSMMSLIVLASFLPTLLLSPFAGVFADRHDRKRVILVSDGAIALATLVLALVYAAGADSIGLLLLVTAVRAAGQAFHGPAVGAILPQMVPPDSLLRINALSGSIQSALTLVSPMLAGALMSLAPFQGIFFIDVATAALAIFLLLLFLRVPPHAKAAEPRTTGYFEDLRLGFSYVGSHRYLAGFFAYLGLILFLVSPSAFLTSLQMARSYGPEVWRLTALEVAFSLGMLAGGGLLSIAGGFRNRMTTIIVSSYVMSLCAVLLGLAPPFQVYLGLMVVFGMAIPYYNAPFATMLQEHVQEDYLGRVYSIFTMISSSVMPLGMLIFGPLGDLVSIEWLLVGSGVSMAAVSAAAMASRTLREMGAPPAAVRAGGSVPGANRKG